LHVKHGEQSIFSTKQTMEGVPMDCHPFEKPSLYVQSILHSSAPWQHSILFKSHYHHHSF
jgi:hypothetical protein